MNIVSVIKALFELAATKMFCCTTAERTEGYTVPRHLGNENNVTTKSSYSEITHGPLTVRHFVSYTHLEQTDCIFLEQTV